MIKRIHRIDRINTNYIANHQRILLKFGDLRCFYSVICGIFVRLIVTISFGESRKGISPIIVYSFKRNNPIPVIVHWAHILSVAIIAQKILFLPRKTAKNKAQLRDCFVMHLLSKSGLPSDSSAQRNRLLCTQIKTKRMMPYNLKPMTAG